MNLTALDTYLPLVCFVFLAGCQQHPPAPKTGIYTQPFASQASVDHPPSDHSGEIRYGMTKDQVLYKLGLPHIDPYAPDVWVYLVLTASQDKSFKITFQNDRIHTVERIYS